MTESTTKDTVTTTTVATGTAFTELRVTFKIKKNKGKEPNTADITVYNLSEPTRSKLKTKGTKIQLEAGYADNVALIFVGDSSIIDHQHDGPDWKTHIQCGDGLDAFKFARYNESFGPDTPVSEVARSIAQTTGLDLSAVKDKLAKLPGAFKNGVSFFGTVSQALDKVLNGTGQEWSSQDGKLQALGETEATSESPVLLDADHGLIGSPAWGSPIHGVKPGQLQKKPQVLKIKTLLNPGLRPGRRITLSAIATKGDFIVRDMEHSGDSFGGEWYSELEAVPWEGE